MKFEHSFNEKHRRISKGNKREKVDKRHKSTADVTPGTSYFIPQFFMLLRSEEVSKLMAITWKEFFPKKLNVRLVAQQTWQRILKQTFLLP